jgi:hypothetical protein
MQHVKAAESVEVHGQLGCKYTVADKLPKTPHKLYIFTAGEEIKM